MRRVLFLACVLLALPPRVEAVPVVVHVNSAGQNNASATISIGMAPTGTNRAMLCGISTQNTTRTGVSVVFNTTESLTFVTWRDFDSAGLQAHAELWKLVNPTATSANVVFTLTGATAVSVGCIAFSDVDQTTPFGTVSDNGARSNTASVDVASATGELVMDVMSMRVGTTGITAGAGQTNYIEQVSGAGAGNVTLGLSTEAGATTTAMTWTVDDTTAKSWASIGVSVKPVGGGGSGRTFTVCTVGCDFTNDQLQVALDGTTCGDSVLLELGHTYAAGSSGDILGDKCATPGWDSITVRTGVTSVGAIMSSGSFPVAGQRVTESDAAVFAKIVPTVNNQPGLRTVYPSETGASCAAAPCKGSGWTVKWLEFPGKADWLSRALVRFGTNNDMVDLPGGDGQDKLAELPQYLTLYQCYVHGDSFAGQHQGLMLSSKDARVFHNRFDYFMTTGETQAITGWSGTGPYDIQNNYIAATTENVIFGGADSFLRLKATVTGTPTASAIQLTTPLWVHSDGTTEAAALNACTTWPCADNQNIYSGIYIAITHGGVDYGTVQCAFSVDTCTLSPTLPFTPSVGDEVRWSWQMGGLTFKYNYVYKRPEWMDPIVGTPTAVTATPVGTGGTLAAGTYCYRVVATAKVSPIGSPNAFSVAAAEQCAVTTGSTSKVTISWTGTTSNAYSYRVYGRTTGAQDRYFEVTAPTVTVDDTGGAGTSASFASLPKIGTRWPVKNNFELKQGDGASPMGSILVEGNLFDGSWCCAQSNGISFKSNNQGKGSGSVNPDAMRDVSAVIRNLTYRNNWGRRFNRAIALTCSNTGNSPLGPSGVMTDVTLSNNLFTDLNDYVSSDSNNDGVLDTTFNSAIIMTTGGFANAVQSRGCVRVTWSHNSFYAESNDLNGPLWLNIASSADKFVDLSLRDNIMARDCTTGGCTSNGTNSLKGFAPSNLGEGTPGWTGTTTGSSAIDHNAWPDGASSVYTNPTFPTANTFFPTDAAVKATHLTNYTNCNANADILGCALQASSNMHLAASDGTDVGADIAAIKAFTDIALSGNLTGGVVTGSGTPSSQPRMRLRFRGGS